MAKKNVSKKTTGAKSGASGHKSNFDYRAFQNKYAKTVLLLAALPFFLLLLSVFKNISYPLFWADESMTAIGTERVMEFGYPKVHDGKNVFYDLRHDNPVLGINPKDDAYIGGAGWAQYYFGIAGHALAEKSTDVFTKTGIFRTTFAIAGILGLLLFALFISRLFTDSFSRNAFVFLFFFLELFSISLALLLREVRYYALVIFLVSVILGLYVRHRFYHPLHPALFAGVMTVSLWCLFNTFAPVFFIVIVSLGMAEGILIILDSLKSNFKTAFQKALPVMITLVSALIGIIPLLSYFKTFEIAKAMNEFNNYTPDVYWTNVGTVIGYFKNFELLWLGLALKLMLLIHIRSIYKSKPSSVKASFFLLLFSVVFVFLIARIPNFIYTRYIIYLQPVWTAMIVLDLILLLKEYAKKSDRLFATKMFIPVGAFFIFLVVMISMNMKNISGHLHELSNQYKGPLDYTIPFLVEKYPASDSMVIAANYEETSYMYYLKSKVVIGFTGNNLAADSVAAPQVVAYRKTWGNYTGIFNKFLQTGQFQSEKFPVRDNPVNNIPELNFKPAFNHQFETLLPADDKDATYLYIKQ